MMANVESSTVAAAVTKQSPLIALLDDKKFLVLDGAMGTELEKRGCKLSDKLWSAKVLMDNPQLIYQVHLDYFRAGADFVLTASYQASVAGFMRFGLDETASRELIAKCVALAKQARTDYLQEIKTTPNKTLLVAGSIGPYGTFLADGSEYRGNYQQTHDEYCAFHRPRIETLIAAGVDVLAFETMPSMNEIKSLLQLLATEFPTTTAYLSLSLRDGQHLCDGTPLVDILPAINKQPQIVAVGFNCYALDKVTDALITLHSLTDRPLIVKPNSGEKYDPDIKMWVDSPGKNLSFEECIDEWIKHGAKMIGGCCRTNPQIIGSIANKLNSIRSFKLERSNCNKLKQSSDLKSINEETAN